MDSFRPNNRFIGNRGIPGVINIPGIIVCFLILNLTIIFFRTIELVILSAMIVNIFLLLFLYLIYLFLRSPYIEVDDRGIMLVSSNRTRILWWNEMYRVFQMDPKAYEGRDVWFFYSSTIGRIRCELGAFKVDEIEKINNLIKNNLRNNGFSEKNKMNGTQYLKPLNKNN